jgi:hypothetical protein
MKKFTALYDASQYAKELCSAWKFASANEFYDSISLPEIAKIHDEESVGDEDSFYVVSDSGAIGYCLDSDTDIDWLFLCRKNIDEILPLKYSEALNKRFCTNCGRQVNPDARFCTGCGNRLS